MTEPMELTIRGYEAVRVTACDDDGPPAVYGRGLEGKRVLVVLLEPLEEE